MSRVAIIGAQCRFPGGASNPDAFFDLLVDGRNFVGDPPGDRWNVDKFVNELDTAGKAYVQRAHYLHYDYTQFDALSFGMAPKEVEFIDPQQRLLLETTWEAFEHAALDIAALAGRPVGVYVGGFTVDHLLNQFAGENRSAIGAHSAAGATLTMLANRISYAFDLTGPSLSIDTACSSSLVAFTQAVQDLEAGRCELAVVGGVNFMLRPEYVVAMCKGRFLARDGRSKSFDAAADGYGRGEGCGVVILKRAADARADGDRVIALVEGCGVNQDGRTSGITVPNPAAQEALMRRVLAASGVDPASVLYVEAHGTGTPLGDPLEAEAIATVYGGGDREAPCVIGSVKSNIGHLEAAAGIAGVIKAAWVIDRNLIPPIAGLESPNPALPLDDGAIELATALRPLGEPSRPRRVAVNSFGYGGANAHVILAAPTPADVADAAPSAAPSSETVVVPVSARTERSLSGAATALADALGRVPAATTDILFTATRRRAHFEHRAAAWGDDLDAARAGLAGFGAGERVTNVVAGEALVVPGSKTAFVYTGMGPQWWGMGRGLWATSAVYRVALEAADAEFAEIAGFSILEEMLRDEPESRIQRTELAQPANLLVQIGLTRALEAEGLRPDAVVGHSVGEVASGWASGMLSLSDALTVSRYRSLTQAEAAGQGAMLAAGIDEAAALAIARSSRGRIDVAAVNGPAAVTLAGERDALAAVAAELEEDGRFAKRLSVEVPYHSAYMDPLKPKLVERLANIQPTAPTTPLYSTVIGGRVEHERFDSLYWADNVRETVRFMAAVQSLLADGVTHFVEVGPHPVLSRAIRDVIKSAGTAARHVPTLSMQEDDRTTFPRAVAAAYVAGVPLDWRRRHPTGRPVEIPTYPFVREHLWRESLRQHDDRLGFGGRALAQSATGTGATGADLAVRRLNFLSDHVVGGAPVMPGAAFLEGLLAAAERAWSTAGGWVAADIVIEAPLVLAADRGQVLTIHHQASTGAAELHSRDAAAADEATRHVTATLRPLRAPAPGRVDPAGLGAGATIYDDVAETYARFAEMGLAYGSTFRTIVSLRRDEGRQVAVARLRLSYELRAEAAGFIAHPTLVDGSFQAALALVPPGDGAYLPVGVAEMRVLRPLPQDLYARIELVARSNERLVCDIHYFDVAGEECAVLRGLACAAMMPRQPGLSLPEADYVDVWEEVAAPPPAGVAPLWVVADRGDPLAHTLVDAARRDREATLLTWTDAALAERLHDAARDGATPPVVALLFGAGLDDEERTGERALAGLRALLTGFAPLRVLAPRVVVVTRSAVAATPADRPNPAQAAIVGFARVAFSELDDLTLDVVDIEAEAPDLDGLLAALATPSVERELALRGGRRLAPMLRPSGIFASPPTVQVRATPAQPLRLADGGLAQQARRAPAADELRLVVEALAVPPVGEPPVLGVVGRLPADDGPGRRVVALVPDDDAARATVLDLPRDTACLADWPEAAPAAVGAAAAVLLPPVLRLREALSALRGGRAAVATTPLGEVLAAALEATGVAVTRIDARPGRWAESDIDAAGAFTIIAAPMAEWARRFGFGSRLAAGGSLIDLAPAPVPFALPAHAGACLRPSAPVLGDGAGFTAAMAEAALSAPPVPARLPLSEWTGDRASFRVVEIDPEVELTADARLAPPLRRDGTYLVTGGFGGLGSETALWLAEHGAGRVAVAGRNGAATPRAEALLRAIAARGATPVPLALDTADEAAVMSTVAALDTPEAPLRGIFHAAGVLADRLVVELSDADIAAVLRPKALGALALDVASRGRTVEHFVLFSSLAVTVGNRRQSNYCAANAFLDALAERRRAEGLPALSVNFGAIAGTGMAADAMVEGHLRQIGLPPLAAHRALAGVAAALHAGVPRIAAAAALDWARFVAHDPRGTRTSRLREVCAPHLDRPDSGRAAELRRELEKAPREERLGAVTVLVGEVVAIELQVDSAVIGPNRPLEEVGVDSLIAVDIQLAIEGALGVNVPTMLLIGRASLSSVAAAVLIQLGLDDDAAASLAAE